MICCFMNKTEFVLTVKLHHSYIQAETDRILPKYFISKMNDKIKKDLQQLLDKLWSEPDLKVTMKNSVKGGIKTGGCAVVGGLVGGPPGFAVGEYINYPFVKQTLKQLMIGPNEMKESRTQ